MCDTIDPFWNKLKQFSQERRGFVLVQSHTQTRYPPDIKEDTRGALSGNYWSWNFLSPLFHPPEQSDPDQCRWGKGCGHFGARVGYKQLSMFNWLLHHPIPHNQNPSWWYVGEHVCKCVIDTYIHKCTHTPTHIFKAFPISMRLPWFSCPSGTGNKNQVITEESWPLLGGWRILWSRQFCQPAKQNKGLTWFIKPRLHPLFSGPSSVNQYLDLWIESLPNKSV